MSEMVQQLETKKLLLFTEPHKWKQTTRSASKAVAGLSSVVASLSTCYRLTAQFGGMGEWRLCGHNLLKLSVHSIHANAITHY